MPFPEICPGDKSAKPGKCRTTTATTQINGVMFKDDDGTVYLVNRTIEQTTCLVCSHSESVTRDEAQS